MPSRSIWRSCSIKIFSDTECGSVIVNRIPVHAYGAIDWRAHYQRELPTAANRITEVNDDPSPTLPLIAAPCLLIWGDADAISPLRWVASCVNCCGTLGFILFEAATTTWPRRTLIR